MAIILKIEIAIYLCIIEITTIPSKYDICLFMHFRYEVLQCGDVEKLIKKRTAPEDPPVYYVCIEDMYDIIKRAHMATGHGGRDRMYKHLGTKYVNITKDAVELFKSYCSVCQEREKARRPKQSA